MISLLQAIDLRHSIRQYREEALESSAVESLQQLISQINLSEGFHFQLITNEPRAFKGKMAYGVFHGVSNYIALVAPERKETATRVGYCGERLVLLAQQLGLSTCWVGLTFNNIREAYECSESQKLYAMIAVGYAAGEPRKHSIKSIQSVSNASASTPEWFSRGVEAALKAPTAVNQQKFRFEYIEGVKVKATRGFSFVGYTRIDLGIAMLHFEIGAAQKIEWIL